MRLCKNIFEVSTVTSILSDLAISFVLTTLWELNPGNLASTVSH